MVRSVLKKLDIFLFGKWPKKRHTITRNGGHVCRIRHKPWKNLLRKLWFIGCMSLAPNVFGATTFIHSTKQHPKDGATGVYVVNIATVTGTVELSTSALTSIVSESTVALRGAGGTTIASESVVGGEALMVINKGATNLEGLTFVYISTPNFQVGSTMTLTGLGNQTILQAFSGFCDFTIDSGSIIRVSTDTEREFPMAHLILNPDVHLSEKGEPAASTICTGFISGAN